MERLLATARTTAALAVAVLGLQSLELRALLGREDRDEAIVLGLASGTELLLLRLQSCLQSLDTRGVIGLACGAKIGLGLLESVEQRLIRSAEFGLKLRGLRLLRIGQVELLGQTGRHLALSMLTAA